jgi:hypothetical protein
MSFSVYANSRQLSNIIWVCDLFAAFYWPFHHNYHTFQSENMMYYAIIYVYNMYASYVEIKLLRRYPENIIFQWQTQTRTMATYHNCVPLSGLVDVSCAYPTSGLSERRVHHRLWGSVPAVVRCGRPRHGQWLATKRPEGCSRLRVVWVNREKPVA